MALTGSRWLVIPIAGALLVAGAITPALVLGQAGAPAQTHDQLLMILTAGEGSRAYAHGLVDYASSHGLTVSAAAQAQLSLGDSLLATAETDAQSGNNVTLGILSAQEAMRDYSYAATSASVALGSSGLAGYADFTIAEGAIADVNSTVNLVSTVASRACGGTTASASGSNVTARACLLIQTHVTAASAHLREAATLVAQAGGQTGAAVDYSQVLSLVSSARADINATQTELATVSGYGYSTRGVAYVNSVIDPLSGQANSTISSEAGVNATYSQFQDGYASYARSESSAAQNFAASAGVLASSIPRVDTGQVTSAFAVAQRVGADVGSNLTALISLPGVSVLPSVVADARSAVSAEGSYSATLTTAKTQWSDVYSQVQLGQFAAFASGAGAEETKVDTAGSGYAGAYGKVLNDLSTLLAIQGVLGVYDNLVSLNATSSINSADTAFHSEVSEMATVSSGVTTYLSAASAISSALRLPNSSLGEAVSVSNAAQTYLNSSGRSGMAAVASVVQSASNNASAFGARVNASAKSTIGAFVPLEPGLVSAETAVDAQINSSISVVAKGAALLHGDLQSRILSAALGRSDARRALLLFSNLEVAQGTEAMTMASLELQASASYGA